MNIPQQCFERNRTIYATAPPQRNQRTLNPKESLKSTRTHRHSSSHLCPTRSRCCRYSGSFLSGFHTCRSDKCPGPRRTRWCLERLYVVPKMKKNKTFPNFTIYESGLYLSHQLWFRSRCCTLPETQLKHTLQNNVFHWECFILRVTLDHIAVSKDSTWIPGWTGLARFSKAVFRISTAAFWLGHSAWERTRARAHLYGTIAGGPHVCVHTHSSINVDGKARGALAAEGALGVDAAPIHADTWRLTLIDVWWWDDDIITVNLLEVSGALLN